MPLETNYVLKPCEWMACAFHIDHSEITVTCIFSRVEETTSVRQRYGMRFMECDTTYLIAIVEQFVKAQPGR